jgi:hypothetical protein
MMNTISVADLDGEKKNIRVEELVIWLHHVARMLEGNHSSIHIGTRLRLVADDISDLDELLQFQWASTPH